MTISTVLYRERLVNCGPMLREKVLEAAGLWKFMPMNHTGPYVVVESTLTFDFGRKVRR